MKTGWWLFILMVLPAALADRAAGAPIVLFSQGSKHYQSMQAVIGQRKPARFYDYHEGGGEPEFGTPSGTATTAIYWDDKRHTLSLICISGSGGSRRRADNGAITWKFRGLPWSTRLALSDDPSEFAYHRQSSAEASFHYRNNADGLILTGLERPRVAWVVKISLADIEGIANWRLVGMGGRRGFASVALDMTKPLYLRVESQASGAPGALAADGPRPVPRLPRGHTLMGVGEGASGSSIPEPGGLMILAAAALLALRRTR